MRKCPLWEEREWRGMRVLCLRKRQSVKSRHQNTQTLHSLEAARRYVFTMKPLLALALLIPACALVPGTDSSREHYFLTEVKPVLQQHCLACHNGSLPPPALNLTSKDKAFKRSPSGRDYILPGDPCCSLLISAVQRGGTHPKMMPRKDVSLTEDQIGMLREWIEDGAYWPEGDNGTLKPVKSTENP